MAAPCDQPLLERIYVGVDGSVKALYEDSSLLLLASSGASFTHVAADSGARTVQLSECCLSRWKPLLAEPLAFRNQHLDMPCLPTWLVQQAHRDGAACATGCPITQAIWPASAQAALQQGLLELRGPQHRVVLHSRCGSAQLVLEGHGTRFAVSYPLLLGREGSSSSSSTEAGSWGRYLHMRHTQVFSCAQCPPRWRPALAVAAAAAAMLAAGGTEPGHPAQQQQQWLQDSSAQQLAAHQLLLSDVTNTMAAAAAAAGGATHPSSGVVAPAAVCGSSTGSGGGISPGGSARRQLHVDSCLERPWRPPGSPGSPSRALYAVAHQQQEEREQEREQEQQGLFLPTPSLSPHRGRPAAAAAAAAAGVLGQQGGMAGCGDSDVHTPAAQAGFVTPLPVCAEVLESLPAWYRQQQQQQQQHCTDASSSGHHVASRTAGSSYPSSASTAGSSGIASALAQTLGVPQQQRPGSNGSSWWLEPSLLLPRDELLAMVWGRDATLVFVQDTEEVEAWLHADDSCLLSFQAGAFVEHIRPATPAAAKQDAEVHMAGVGTAAPRPRTAGQEAAVGGLAGAGAGAGVAGGGAGAAPCWWDRRVFPAGGVPTELCVPVCAPHTPAQLAAGSPGSNAVPHVVVPLGRVAAEALKLRSTMARVQQDLRAAAAAAPASAPRAHNAAAASKQLCCMWGAVRGAAAGPLLAADWRAGGRCQHQHQHHNHHSPAHQLSLSVAEQQEVPGLGIFTAYADGRVRVVFEDRALLALSGDGAIASVTLPDGSVQQVAASNPVGVEQYVQPALEFGVWAAHTPVQRAAVLRTQALVAAELRGSARMAAICEWGSNPERVPAAAACAAGNLLKLGGPRDAGACFQRPPAGGPSEESWCAGDSRQQLVQEMLSANAALLQRL